MNETPSSEAKGGISYSPEYHICPHNTSVLFQPACSGRFTRLWPTVISSFLVSRHCVYQFLGSLNYLIIDHVNALATNVASWRHSITQLLS